MTRLVGLFYFNIQYVAGDFHLYHRYCLEAIRPFLEAIVRNPDWRTSFCLSGAGLEFLAQHYPSIIDSLRRLVRQGRVELVASTYTPALWPAFPKRDLLKSIEFYDAAVEGLGLPKPRVFFPHESFFGRGLRCLADRFDLIVCKDDYLSYFLGAENVPHALSLGRAVVAVGSNHILNELRRKFDASGSRRRFPFPLADLPPAFRKRLETAPAPAVTPGTGFRDDAGDEWRWYHLGSGHHFCTCYAPEDRDRFFADPLWIELTESLLNSYLSEGASFATVGEFARAAPRAPESILERTVEGSLDSHRSGGIYAWMGRQESPVEQDATVLSAAWRARAQLRRIGEALNGTPESRGLPQRELRDAWSLQLLAESADPLGWAPTPGEVVFGRRTAEEAWRVAQSLRERLRDAGKSPDSAFRRRAAGSLSRSGDNQPPSFFRFELYGGRGEACTTFFDKDHQLLDIELCADSSHCGVRFPEAGQSVTYCPSAAEDAPVTLSLDNMKPEIIFLPLTNGLLGLEQNRFIIRENSIGYLAAGVCTKERAVVFGAEGLQRGARLHLRFRLLRTTWESAVKLAAAINAV